MGGEDQEKILGGSNDINKPPKWKCRQVLHYIHLYIAWSIGHNGAP